VPVGLRLGPIGDTGPLLVVRRVRLNDRLVVQEPAFAALRGA
jgi:hypothetical protein